LVCAAESMRMIQANVLIGWDAIFEYEGQTYVKLFFQHCSLLTLADSPRWTRERRTRSPTVVERSASFKLGSRSRNKKLVRLPHRSVLCKAINFMSIDDAMPTGCGKLTKVLHTGCACESSASRDGMAALDCQSRRFCDALLYRRDFESWKSHESLGRILRGLCGRPFASQNQQSSKSVLLKWSASSLEYGNSLSITWMLEVDWRQACKMDSVLYTRNAFSKVSLYGIKKALF
jgi:hypothetical protein